MAIHPRLASAALALVACYSFDIGDGGTGSTTSSSGTGTAAVGGAGGAGAAGGMGGSPTEGGGGAEPEPCPFFAQGPLGGAGGASCLGDYTCNFDEAVFPDFLNKVGDVNGTATAANGVLTVTTSANPTMPFTAIATLAGPLGGCVVRATVVSVPDEEIGSAQLVLRRDDPPSPKIKLVASDLSIRLVREEDGMMSVEVGTALEWPSDERRVTLEIARVNEQICGCAEFEGSGFRQLVGCNDESIVWDDEAYVLLSVNGGVEGVPLSASFDDLGL